jgi:hypothetical protein
MHTPGPWIVLSDSPAAIRTIDGSNIAPEVCHLEDARLMAAAPDLLAALKLAYRHLNGGSDSLTGMEFAEAHRLARAAIARATSKD